MHECYVLCYQLCVTIHTTGMCWLMYDVVACIVTTAWWRLWWQTSSWITYWNWFYYQWKVHLCHNTIENLQTTSWKMLKIQWTGMPVRTACKRLYSYPNYYYYRGRGKLITYMCEQFFCHLNYRKCLASQDPYCVWNSNTESCEASTLTADRDRPGLVSSL